MKKSYTCESILSLLVKIVYSSKKSEWEQNTSEYGKSSNFILEIDFLKGQNLDHTFYESRVGDESDFMINLLEKFAQLDRKCNLIINKTLETLNSVVLKQQSSQPENVREDGSEASQDIGDQNVKQSSLSNEEDMK